MCLCCRITTSTSLATTTISENVDDDGDQVHRSLNHSLQHEHHTYPISMQSPIQCCNLRDTNLLTKTNNKRTSAIFDDPSMQHEYELRTQPTPPNTQTPDDPPKTDELMETSSHDTQIRNLSLNGTCTSTVTLVQPILHATPIIHQLNANRTGNILTQPSTNNFCNGPIIVPTPAPIMITRDSNTNIPQRHDPSITRISTTKKTPTTYDIFDQHENENTSTHQTAYTPPITTGDSSNADTDLPPLYDLDQTSSDSDTDDDIPIKYRHITTTTPRTPFTRRTTKKTHERNSKTPINDYICSGTSPHCSDNDEDDMPSLGTRTTGEYTHTRINRSADTQHSHR